MTIFPTGIPTAAPDNTDNIMFSDTSDWDQLKKNTPWAVVWAWLPSNDTDSLPEWTTNLYLTPWERVKLASVQTWAEVNSVDSVNWQTWVVALDQDDVPDGTTFVRTNNNFTNTNVSKLNAASNHLTDFANPHNTTPANIGIGNVTNDKQLSTSAGNFSALVEKSDIQQHLDDLFVLQDSDDGDIIKKITNKTDLIWKASLCQIRWPSINYYRFNFVSSTTYDIRSIVVFGGNLYQCTVNHQSSGSFAADLALGYWNLVGTGWVPGWVAVIAWSGNPNWVVTGTSLWDLYIDYTNNQLWIWDWSVWNLVVSPTVFPVTTWIPWAPGTTVWEWRFDPADGNIYIWDWATWVVNEGAWGTGWINYLNAPVSVGNKLVFSVWVNADTIDESVISYNALPTPTLTMGWVTTTWVQNFDSGYVSNFNWSTENYDNSYQSNYNGSTTNYNNSTTTGTENFDSNYTSNYDGSTMNYTQITQNFTDTPNQISCEVTPIFWAPFTAVALTQRAEVKIEYDNTVDPVVTKTIKTVLDGVDQTISFVTATDSGTITTSWAAWDLTVTISSGTAGFFSFDATEGICRYNGVSVNNYLNKIHIHNGDITENTNTTENNFGVTNTFDNTSIITNNGTTILNGNTVINGTTTFTWPVIWIANPALISTGAISVAAAAVQVLAVPANCTYMWINMSPLQNIYFREGIYETTGAFSVSTQDYFFDWNTGTNQLTVGQVWITSALTCTVYYF